MPSPNVAENHQYKNAMALVDNEAAVLVPDAEAGSLLGPTVIELLKDVGRCDVMSANIRRMALPDSAARIVDCIDGIVDAESKNKTKA